MAFTIPSEETSQAQSWPSLAHLHQCDIDILIAGLDGSGVYNGCAVTAQGTPNNTVAVAAGNILAVGVLTAVAAGNVTMTAADATNPRIDLVYCTSAGVKTWLAGTAAAAPRAPALPAGGVALALVYVPANDTALATDQIVDKRVLLDNWVWNQASVPAAITAAADTAFANTLTLPANSFYVGQVIRVTARGLTSFAATPGTLIARVKFGASVLALTPTLTGVTQTDGHWEIDGEITITAIGSGTTGKAEFSGTFTITNVSTFLTSITIPLRNATPTAPMNFDSTADQVLTITMQPSVATGSRTLRQFIVRNNS